MLVDLTEKPEMNKAIPDPDADKIFAKRNNRMFYISSFELFFFIPDFFHEWLRFAKLKHVQLLNFSWELWGTTGKWLDWSGFFVFRLQKILPISAPEKWAFIKKPGISSAEKKHSLVDGRRNFCIHAAAPRLLNV